MENKLNLKIMISMNVVRSENGWKLEVVETETQKEYYWVKGDRKDLIVKEEVA